MRPPPRWKCEGLGRMLVLDGRGTCHCVGCVCPRPAAPPRGLGRVCRVISGQVWSPGFPRLPAKSRGVTSEKKGHPHLQSKQTPLDILGCHRSPAGAKGLSSLGGRLSENAANIGESRDKNREIPVHAGQAAGSSHA